MQYQNQKRDKLAILGVVMPRGGKRENSGAKHKDPDQKAKRVTFTLHPATIAEIKAASDALEISQAKVVARAVRKLSNEIEGQNEADSTK